MEIRRQIRKTFASNHAVGPKVRVPHFLLNMFLISNTVALVLTNIPCVFFMITSWNVDYFSSCWVAVIFSSLSTLETEQNTCLNRCNVEEEVGPCKQYIRLSWKHFVSQVLSFLSFTCLQHIPSSPGVLHSAKTTSGTAGALGELSAVWHGGCSCAHEPGSYTPFLPPASGVNL